MKKFKYITVQLVLCCLIFSGCDKYLDVEPRGKQLLKTTNDFDLWLNSFVLTSEFESPLLNYMEDNMDYPPLNDPPTTLTELVYTWKPQFSNNLSEPAYLWADHYRRINLFNTVLLGIDAAEGGTPSQKNSLKAEALLGRANSYFYLVNEYGKPYDPATAATDLAVPFVTSDDVSQKIPPRNTVAEIYKHIIDDINAAMPNLPPDNSNARFRGSQAAGYSVLARVYFYRREYTEAQRYAELAIANTRAKMIDYTSPTTFPTNANVVSHPDGIYSRSHAPVGIPITVDFKAMFANNDARRTVLYYNWGSTIRGGTSFYAAAVTPVLQLTNSGTTVQEMHLIVAECAARANDLSKALSHLNEVRRNRYTGAPVASRDFTSTDQTEVFEEILDERRRELAFHSIRWFDMRRLDSENMMPVVTRTNADNTIVARLEPKSNRYTLQIPTLVISFNPEMKQNP